MLKKMIKPLILTALAVSMLFLALPVYSITGNNGLEIVESTTSHIILKYEPQVQSIEQITTNDGISTQLPVIDGVVRGNNTPGAPMKLVLSKKITVPGENGFSLDEVRISGKRRIPGKITPVGQLFNVNDFPETRYDIDKKLYSGNITDRFVELSYKGIARNRYIAELNFTAASYDAVTNSIVIPEEIYVKISFNQFYDSRISKSSTPEFDPNITLNHYETKEWVVSNTPIDTQGKKNTSDRIMSVTDNWVKVGIDVEGVYKINAGMLSNLGVKIPKDEVSTIQLFGNGGKELSQKVSDGVNNSLHEQEIIVKTNSSGEFLSLIFYGRPGCGFEYKDGEIKHYINHYSPIKKNEGKKRNNEKNFYFLTWGGEEGKRAESLETPQGNVTDRPDTYTRRIFYEEELENAFVHGSGLQWFGRNLLPWQITNLLHDLDRSGRILYRIAVAHRSFAAGYFTVTEDDEEIANIYLGGVNSKSYNDAYRDVMTAEFPASEISSDNRSILKFSYSSQENPSATGYFDYYEIHYPRSFIPINNEISFFTEPGKTGIYEYFINGFSGGEIYGFDVTDARDPKLIENLASTGGIFKFRTELSEDTPKQFYISSKIRENPELSLVNFHHLRHDNSSTDMIVISPPEFKESAQEYKEYRSKQSDISVSVFYTDDIYNEFASGIPDPTAVRDFIAYAYHNWDKKPKYVLLWGDGHYDFKNITTDKKNYVPPYESINYDKVFDATDSYTTDDFFGRVEGDDLLVDLAVGRMTIQADYEGKAMVGKIDHYENNSSEGNWQTNVTLVADDSKKRSGSDGSTHTTASEKLSKNNLPLSMQQRKIYLPDYPTENVPGGRRKPRCTEDILNSVNVGGTLLLNWYGHGNPRVWSHEEVLDRDVTIPKMLNYDKLFFLTAATCDYGRFDSPEVQSGAEEMVINDKGGGIGCFSSSRLVYAGENEYINELFYNTLFTKDESDGRYNTIGEVMYKVKQEATSLNDQKYWLLGDPALRLVIPNYHVQIESINGINLVNNDDTLKLKGLQEVTIKGSILESKSEEIDETFNGTAIITMLDGDNPSKVPDEDGYSTHNILRHGGALNRSSCPVENGHFEANFIIPKDISFSENLGRLYVYANSDDERFAKGATRNYMIDGILTTGVSDDTGPQIDIFVDGRDFKPGDIVSGKPRLIVDLSDTSGINTTGNGIGHRIEAWLDDEPESYDLTMNFVTSVENPRKGTTEKELDQLEPGVHKVKVRAWDVYNNYSTSETYFRVAPKGEVVVHDLKNYPNPFEDGTTIKFKHNLKPPFDVKVHIYSITGNLIRSFAETGTTYYTTEVEWDGLDSNNNSLVPGVYPFKVLLKDENGSTGFAAGKMSVTR